MLERYGYFYERKNKQYKAIRGPNKKKIVPSPKAAQAYLAIARAKPANARGYLGAIWADFYSEIFQSASVADLLASYRIYQICHLEASTAKTISPTSARERDCRVYGVFHIARAMGHLLLNDNWGHGNMGSVEKLINDLETDPHKTETYIKALEVVIAIRTEDEASHPIPAMYFKNTASQRKLNAKLKGPSYSHLPPIGPILQDEAGSLTAGRTP